MNISTNLLFIYYCFFFALLLSFVYRSQTQKFKVKSNGSSRHGAGMQASGAASIGVTDNTEFQASNIGIKSVLEVDDLTDFLVKAELANREFASEREQFLVLDNVAQQVVPKGSESKKRVQWDDSIKVGDGEEDLSGQQTNNTFEFCELAVPRRPKWDKTTTKEQLDLNEKESFLQWRRAIATREEQVMASSAANKNARHVSVTPFEKNLEVWRQVRFK